MQVCPYCPPGSRPHSIPIGRERRLGSAPLPSLPRDQFVLGNLVLP